MRFFAPLPRPLPWPAHNLAADTWTKVWPRSGRHPGRAGQSACPMRSPAPSALWPQPGSSSPASGPINHSARIQLFGGFRCAEPGHRLGTTCATRLAGQRALAPRFSSVPRANQDDDGDEDGS